MRREVRDADVAIWLGKDVMKSAVGLQLLILSFHREARVTPRRSASETAPRACGRLIPSAIRTWPSLLGSLIQPWSKRRSVISQKQVFQARTPTFSRMYERRIDASVIASALSWSLMALLRDTRHQPGVRAPEIHVYAPDPGAHRSRIGLSSDSEKPEYPFGWNPIRQQDPSILYRAPAERCCFDD